MNRIEITVLKPHAALDAFAETWKRVEAGDEAKPRLAFGSLRALFSAITEKRLELLRDVATHETLNVRQLAAGLGRNEGIRLSRDSWDMTFRCSTCPKLTSQ